MSQLVNTQDDIAILTQLQFLILMQTLLSVLAKQHAALIIQIIYHAEVLRLIKLPGVPPEASILR